MLKCVSGHFNVADHHFLSANLVTLKLCSGMEAGKLLSCIFSSSVNNVFTCCIFLKLEGNLYMALGINLDVYALVCTAISTCGTNLVASGKLTKFDLCCHWNLTAKSNEHVSSD
jgi:hypothetical protein